MFQRIALQLALMASLAGLLPAQDAVDRLIPAAPTGYLTDAAGIVDPSTAADIDRLAERLRAATGAEVAVVTLPTLGDRSEAEVALRILRRWGVGARADIGDSTRNAGAVLLLVPRQGGQPGSGAIRIEVGYGLEGIVTDAAAGQIRDLMLPAARQEQYGEALLTGTRALVGTIARGFGVTDSTLAAARPPPSGEFTGAIPMWLPILLFIAFMVLTRRGRRRRRVYWGPWIGGGWGGGGGFGGGSWGGGGFGGFGGGGGGGGGGAGGRF